MMENSDEKNKYNPLSGDRLRELLKSSKGIETLWKKIKDNKDGKKSILYKYENDLVELVAEFTEALAKTVEASKTTNPIDLGKNLASKDDYRVMITKLLTGTGEADAFIKKFPHWTIQVGNLFTNSIHYQRIASKVSGSGIKKAETDIDKTSSFDVTKKSGDKKTGKESKKGFFKSISSFFNKYIKRGGMGKASKSKVTIELAKFGKYVNEPWRRWWETVADSNTELSKKKAKEFLKSALSDSTADSKSRLVCLFNTGTVKDNAGSEGPYVKLNDTESGAKVVVDVKAGAVNQMYQIFKAIDAKLGNKAEALFNGAESAKNLDTNDDKIKRLIELHKIFYTDKKAIRFSEVFDKLGIKTNDKPETKAVEEKVNELFNGSTFSNNDNAKKDVKKLAEDARKFLENYYNSDKTKRLLYELKFLGSAFKFSDLNDVTSVDQAINVLDRAPNVLDAIEINDPKVAEQIEEKIANSTKNIKSLGTALKDLDKADFNQLENQNKLLTALTAIVNNGLIDGVSGGKISLVEFINKLLDIEKGKYRSIAEKIQGMKIYKKDNNKSLADFIDELKKPLKEAEAQKIKEQDEKIKVIEKLFESIKDEEKNYNGGKKPLNDPKEGIKIITEIEKLVNYTGENRSEFLKAVAKHIGINDTKIVDKISKDKPSELAKELKNDKSYLLLQKIRNLIAYGIFGHKSFFLGRDTGSTSNKMPEKLMHESV